MSKPFPDTSFGVGLVVVVTLPAPVTEKIKEAAKKRGKTVAGWCRAELIPAVEMPGSDDRIRAVLDAATAAERRAAAGRLTGADWERIADGVRISPAELEAAAEKETERGEPAASWSPAELITLVEGEGSGGLSLVPREKLVFDVLSAVNTFPGRGLPESARRDSVRQVAEHLELCRVRCCG